jgi:hypothetical protein
LDYVTNTQLRVNISKWETLLGELWSIVLAIPGGLCLFSILQEVLKRHCDNDTCLQLTPIVHSVIRDFLWLTTIMVRRPTWIAELIPARHPATLGAHDASGMGMGGVHFVTLPNGEIQPFLQRERFNKQV